jgi:hypothetical protein
MPDPNPTSSTRFTDEQIRQYLRDSGSPEHIVRAGRGGLIERWQKFVQEVEGGYHFGLEDYRNDLDLRGIIENVGLSGDAAVIAADEKLKPLLVPTANRIWESCSGEPFWDFGYPKRSGRDLQHDLKREGLLEA